MIVNSMLTLLVVAGQVNNAQEAKDYFAKLLECRQKVRSGHFIATGVVNDAEGQVTIECWFSGNRWRIRRQNSGGVWTVLVTGEFSYVQLEDLQVMLTDEDNAQRYVRWFDIRSVGLANRFSLYGRPNSLEKIVAAYVGGKYHLQVESADDDSVTLKRGPILGNNIEQTIVLDARRAFVPQYILSKDPKGSRIQKTTWEEVDGVYVPTKYSERRNGKDEVLLDFEWLSVNEEDLQAFDQRKLFPGGTRFVKRENRDFFVVNRPVEKWWSETKEEGGLEEKGEIDNSPR